jgi:hypothetical protein
MGRRRQKFRARSARLTRVRDNLIVESLDYVKGSVACDRDRGTPWKRAPPVPVPLTPYAGCGGFQADRY